PPEDSGTPWLAARTYLRDCFTKPYYYWVFTAMILPGLCFQLIYIFNLPYSTSVGMSLETYGKLMALFFFLSLLQAVPRGWLVDKFHPLRVAMVTLVLHGAAALWGGFFGTSALQFGVAFVLGGTLSGSWITATEPLTMLLLPKMKYAQYASAL